MCASKYTHRMYVALIIIGINTRHTFTALDCIGCKKNDGRLEIEWETPENQAKTRERVQHVLNGCKCKTGCTTKRCKCKRQLQGCGPGCHCLNCQNMPIHQSSWKVDEEIHQLEVEDQDQHEATEEYVDDSDEDDRLEMNDEGIDEIMDNVFGSESDTEEMILDCLIICPISNSGSPWESCSTNWLPLISEGCGYSINVIWRDYGQENV